MTIVFRRVFIAGMVLATVSPGACAEETPEGAHLDGSAGTDASLDAGTLPDGGNNPSCTALATDYSSTSEDSWPACVSDDGLYHPFDPNISSLARVSAFEEIAGLLFTGTAPSAEAFVQARLAYAQSEGLESRVARREDEHYSVASKACADMTAEELAQNKERCVGPAQILPLLNQAFKEGPNGVDPALNAARVEAALLWFLYVSVHKEAMTCTGKNKDCDSAYAYYTGGEPRDSGKGLSRYLRALSIQAHDRVWDGVLAVRCWRELDPAEVATNTALRNQAVAQLDRALLRGMALIVKGRAVAFDGLAGDARAAQWGLIRTIGGVLDREARVRDAAKAEALRAVLSKTAPIGDDMDAVITSVDAIFPCP